jgi:hypothetical protein
MESGALIRLGMGFWFWSPPTFGVGKGRFTGHPVLGWRRVSVPWAMGRCKILMLVSQLSRYSGGSDCGGARY